MRFAALGSGSRGNAWLVESGRTRILVDCGFGPRETVRRLARLDVEPESIQAVAVTHEHTDHIGGAAACGRRFGWALWMTHGSAAAHVKDDAIGKAAGSRPAFAYSPVNGQDTIEIGELCLQPFTVPHDAREPVQFVISDGRAKLGILTDAGHVTRHMVETLGGCAALVLECNHDPAMLRSGRYPLHLQKRISGKWGHLDNQSAADLLAAVDRSALRHVVAAHLSEENNRRDLAQAALAGALMCSPDEIEVAEQEAGFGWCDV